MSVAGDTSPVAVALNVGSDAPNTFDLFSAVTTTDFGSMTIDCVTLLALEYDVAPTVPPDWDARI